MPEVIDSSALSDRALSFDVFVARQIGRYASNATPPPILVIPWCGVTASSGIRNRRMSPEIPTDAGWIALYAMYAVCWPVHLLNCNRRPATPSGVAESCWGGRLAATAISVVTASLLIVFEILSWVVRSNSWPGRPGPVSYTHLR